MAASVRGFDVAAERERQNAIAVAGPRARRTRSHPAGIGALAQSLSEGSAKLPAMPEETAAATPKLPPDSSRDGRRPAARRGARARREAGGEGLRTVGDLLLNLPRRYEDRRTPRTVAEAPVGERSVIAGRIVKAQEERGRRRRLEVLVRDDAGGTLVCIWFHYRPSFLQRFPFTRMFSSPAKCARATAAGER